jgi:hypothetical protein
VYWQPVFNLLEGHFKVWVVNAQHIKKVPGRAAGEERGGGLNGLNWLNVWNQSIILCP